MRSLYTIFTGAVLLVSLMHPENVSGSHLRAADIRVERICGTLTFRITVTAYLNSESGVLFGANGHVYFGDGTSIKIPETLPTLRPELGLHISTATFITEHTYASNGEFTISYVETNRNSGVLNVAQSASIPYSSFVKIKVDDGIGCNTVPVLTVFPVDRACTGKIFFHNPGAFDAEGDSLSYALVIPSGGDDAVVTYKAPNDNTFYPGFFPTGNEAQNAPPTFSINPQTGLLTWDAPGLAGEYNVAFTINEWRKNAENQYILLSSTIRDMQIIVEDCDNDRPDIIAPADTCVVAGATLNKKISGTDSNGDPVKLEIYSEITRLPADRSPATYSPLIPVFEVPPSMMEVNWNTSCTHVRQQPYQVVFKNTDDHNGIHLVTYKTWNIHIVAPAPEWESNILDVVNHHAVLKWDAYACDNAQKIQVWRRVGSFQFIPGKCETGLPPFAGYSLVAELDPLTQTFVDTNNTEGLAPGAQYCYRLLAVFPDTKSIVSEEMCVGPVQADAPVITHVSVEKTSAEGNIRISWRSPFNINEVQFPKPYQYEVYRSAGITASTEPILISERIQDTTFLDAGISTDNNAFNYRVVIYAKPQFSAVFVAVDTSAVASSVRLSSTPGDLSVELRWLGNVPWSNTVQQRPYHLIYRAPGIAAEEDLELIDSVDVTETGFHYVDENIADANQPYTYRIQTRGSYGNPKIALQKNFSQLLLTYPANNMALCAPNVSIQATDCDAYLKAANCDNTDFKNTFQWSFTSTTQCRFDVQSYNVYGANTTDGEYQLLASGITQTSFVENNLPSFARCYRVAAVDRTGNEGPLSEPVCNDNCPYFQLPNVFTPNADGCNDMLSARYNMDSEGSFCPVAGTEYCPRFVKAVNFTVVNRWGREVYHFTSNENSSIYIDWNGKDRNNEDLGSGVYYFVADVTFDVINPADRRKKIKGWVQLLR